MAAFQRFAIAKWLLSVLAACCLWPPIQGLVPSTGECGLHVFVPFTTRINSDIGIPATLGQEPEVEWSNFLTSDQDFSLGYYQMAAGLMAMDDFNARDNSIVPELKELTEGCNVKFDMNNSVFVDSSNMAHSGTTELMDEIREMSSFPCAIAGPFNDVPAQNMAVIASAARIPHMPHRGYNYRLSDPWYSPYTNMIFPDMIVIGDGLGKYLRHIQRDKYIAIMHTAAADTGIQRGEGIGIGMEKAGVQVWESYAYAVPLWYIEAPGRDIRTVLGRVKDRGFRTIVVAMSVYFLELPILANVAEELGMNNGDYVWIFHPDFEMEAIYNLIHTPEEVMEQRGLPSFANVTKLLTGAALIQPVEPYQYMGESEPFLWSWKSKDADFVDRLNEFAGNSSIQNLEGKEQVAHDFFQTHEPQLGTAYLYDAILSIGIGACVAQDKDETQGEVTGAAHVKGIHSASFTGATGSIRYDQKFFRNTRDPKTVSIGVFNLYPPNTTIETLKDTFVLTEIVQNLNGAGLPNGKGSNSVNWTQVGPDFVFANGETISPALLRDEPDQNYLSKWLHIVGLTFMSINLALGMACILWVVLHWECRVVRASQPYFLLLVIFGAMTCSCAILAHSFDESYGWSPEELSKMCISGPWLFCLGYVITYGALFTKLWRINKVLQFRRRQVNANTVAGPMIFLILLAIVVLTVWTTVAPMEWQRIEVDDVTGESIGRCESDSSRIFLPMLLAIGAAVTFLACFMAYKTRDIDDAYSESKWIFTLVVAQIQVSIVGIPVAFILSEISTDGQYIGISGIMFLIPLSTLGLIMAPKVARHYSDLRGGDSVKIRGAHGNVVVSGISRVTDSTKKAEAAPRTSSLVHPEAAFRDSVQTTAAIGRTSDMSRPQKFNDSYQLDFHHESAEDSEIKEQQAGPPYDDELDADDPSFHE